MENRLKNLNRLVDKEMSPIPVFTNTDEQNILASIKNPSPQRIIKKKKTLVPRLLTAALFAGVFFTSYTIVDKYFTPEIAKVENKPETRYAQEFTQTSSKITYDVATRELTIQGSVKNATDFNSEHFQARVNILKDDLAADLGTKSLNLDVSSNGLKPDASYSFKKKVKLNINIVDENTFKNALEAEIYSKSKTLTSFVITNVEYKEPPSEMQAVEKEETPSPDKDTLISVDEPEKSVTETEVKQGDGKNKTEPVVKEEEIPEPTLAELEKLFGKKKTPFGNIPVERRVQDQTFLLNGITLGMSKEETLQILGPYDKFYNDDNIYKVSSAQWNMVTADKNSIKNNSEFNLDFNADQKVTYISFFTLHNSYVEEWAKTLGEPYHVTDYGESFYYFENTEQMLCLDAVYFDYGNNHYQVTLWHEENPEEYKNAVD